MKKNRKYAYFGYEFKRDPKIEKNKSNGVSFAPPDSNDGAITIDYTSAAGGFYSQYVDFDASYRTDKELISQYRRIVKIPEVDSATDDIINEAINTGNKMDSVRINLDNVDLSDSIKKTIFEEFDYVLRLMDFNNRGYEIFRKWYVDSKLYFHKMIDTKAPEKGIQELRIIDPTEIRKIKEVERSLQGENGTEVFTVRDEYYIYLGKYYSSLVGIKINADTITFVPSGLYDPDKRIVLGYLYKAIKPANQLRMMEDAVVIYRIARAPERRIFYVDVGNLPLTRAEQYVKQLMTRYQNKLVYDASTGEVRDDKRHMSMLEDFWMPRREGGRGTEITTLQGGQNLGDIEDILYFQKNLYRSLNVPLSRMDSETGFNLGRSSEITRDELKFSKFIDRLRTKFSEVFFDILKTQLVLKKIMSVEDWNKIKPDIFFDFVRDNFFTELKEGEILKERLATLRDIEGYAGRFFSDMWIRKHVLQQTDEEIKQSIKEIAEEAKAKANDPNQQEDDGF